MDVLLLAFLCVLVAVMVVVSAVLVYVAVERDIHAAGSTVAFFALVIGAELLLAGAGVFSHFDRTPPSFTFLLLPLLLLNVSFSCCSHLGGVLARRLSLRTLVGFQCFRLGPEAFLHFGHLDGIVPAQMTWPPVGRNVDLYVAVFALGLLVRPRPLAAPVTAWGFALFGFGSLLNIFWIVACSLISPLRDWVRALGMQIEPGLEAAATPPFILLPGVLVQLALSGHLLLFRKLIVTTTDTRMTDAERRFVELEGY